MKKSKFNKHRISYFAIFVVSSLLISVGLITTFSINKITYNNKSITNKNANINSNDENQDSQDDLAKIVNQSTFSKEINCHLSFSNQPYATTKRISYVNGYNETVLEVWIDNNNNILARSPKPIRIETIDNKTEINDDNFNISLTSYSSSPYAISSSNKGYKINQPEVNNLPWIVQNETYLNPYDKNTHASNYVEFNTLSPNAQVIGTANNGYAELKIHLKLPKIPPEPQPGGNNIDSNGTYFGPNIIDIAPGYDYSSSLGIKGQRYNSNLDNIVIDDTIVFTKLDNGHTIYRNNINSSYSTNIGNLSSSNLITASEFLDKIKVLTVNADNVYHYSQNFNNNNDVITPRIFGYADDINGNLAIVTYKPYLIKQGKVSFEEPNIYTLTGFKKNNSLIANKKLVINSNQINFINHSANKQNMFSANLSGNTQFNYGFELSPLSLFDFSIQNHNLMIKPTTNPSISNKLILNNLFNNNNLFNWDLIGQNKVFNTYSNAVSNFLLDNSEFNNYLNNFNYGSDFPAQLLSGIITNQPLNIKSTPLSNIFNINDASKFPGPWVIDPSTIEITSDFSSQYINYLQFLKQKQIFENNKEKFNQKISLQILNENNKFIQLKQLFGSSLPILKDASDFTKYFETLNMYNISSITDQNITNSYSNNKYLETNFMFYENGPVIMASANSLNRNSPYVLDSTNVLVWDDIKGISHLSFENNNIFSSKENLDFNLNQLGLSNPNFGSTYFVLGNNNAGLGDVSNIAASDFISDLNNLNNLTIEAYNCLLANNDNTKITLIANDDIGELTISLSPYLVTQLNQNFYQYSINSLEQFNNMNAVEMASLLNSNIINDNENYVSFTISGFKKTHNNSNSSIQPGFSNAQSYPLQAFTTSSIIGTDLEANLEKFKTNIEDYKNFESFIIADALNKLQQEKIINFFNPHNTNNHLIDNINNNKQLNLENFNNIISRFNLFSSDKYNQYIYDVWFNPYTLKDMNNNFNNQEIKIRLTISTTGQNFNSWVANDYISTGLSQAYASKSISSPIPNQISKTDFVNNFAKLLTKQLTYNQANESNILRFYQNGHFYNNANQNKVDETKITLNPINNDQWKTYDLFLKRTSPIIYSYNDQYGFDYSPLGVINYQNYSESIQDFNTWNISYSIINSVNSNNISISYKPKIWMKNGKFITNGIEPKTITFGEIVQLEGINTSLDNSNMTAYNTDATPYQIYQAIKSGVGDVYNNYLERIKNRISNILPDQSKFPNVSGTTNIQLKVAQKYLFNNENDPNTTQETKDAWKQAQKDGNFQIEVWISGDYFENNNIPINNSTPKCLGTINIVNLKKAKITRFNQQFTIPDIMQYNLTSELAEYIWVRSMELCDSNSIWINFKDVYNLSNNPELVSSFNQLLNQGLIIDGYYQSQTTDTNLQFNAQNISINNFNNNDGTFSINANDAQYTGQYYDEYGRVNTTSGVHNSESLTISGFKKVLDNNTVVNSQSNEIIIDSLLNRNVASIDENQIRNLLLSNNIIANYPALKYGNLGLNNITDKNLIDISITNRDSINGKITFNYTINSVIATVQNNAKVIAIKGIKYFDQLNANNQLFLSGTLTIKGLEKASQNQETTINRIGFSSEQFANEIITSILQQNNINLNTDYDDSNIYIKKIMDNIIQYNIIQNLPEELSTKNMKINITSVDNVQGIMTLDIKLNKFYYWDYSTNSIQLYNGSEFKKLTTNSTTSIIGFKKIKAATSVKQTTLTISNNLKPANLHDTKAWQKVIFSLIPSIFNNAPITSNETNIDLNNPTLTINDIIISSNPNVSADLNSVTLNVSLNSYFCDDTTWSTIIWNKQNASSQAKSFGEITFTGLNNQSNTEIVSNIYLDPTIDGILINVLPSQIEANDIYKTSILLLIQNRGLTGNIPNTLSINNINIDEYIKSNNLTGELTLKISINNYYENNINIIPTDNKPKSSTVTISGFRSISKTIIQTQYNGSFDTSINSKYAYQYTIDDLKKLVYNQLISNTTDDFSISNINIQDNIAYDNQNGTITFVPIISNFYNDQGNIINTPVAFDQVIISGFKLVKTSTTIDSINYVQDIKDRNSLAISFLNYASSNNIQETDILKTYVLNHMINNAPNININDIHISGISVNNITGTINATVSLNKYIDQYFNVVNVNENNNFSPLNKNIIILGFMNVGATNISSTIYIDQQYQNTGSIEFVKNDQNGNILKQFIFNNIQNKWHSQNENNDFTINDFELYNIKPNNLDGTIKLQVGFKKYIDNNGQYQVISVGSYPYLIDIVIKGFKQIPSSMILDTFNIPSQEDVYAHNYIANEQNFKQQITSIIFNNLLINKIPQSSTSSGTTESDIKVVETIPNNNTGTIQVKVLWQNHFVDYRGQPVTSPSSNPLEQIVTFTGFKQMSAPTSVNQSIDINQLNTLPSDYADVTKTNSSQNELAIKKEIIKNLNNAPEKYDPNLKKYVVDITEQDISIIRKQMSDGKEYLGQVNNFFGSLVVEFTLSKYYDDNYDYVDTTKDVNKIPKILNTTFINFKKTDLKPTIIKNNLNLKTDISKNSNDWNYIPEAFAYINETSKNFVVNNNIKYVLLKSAMFSNWTPLNRVLGNELGNWTDIDEYHQALKNVQQIKLQEIYSKIKIEKKNYGSTWVNLQIRIIDWVSPTDGIKVEGKFSNVYNVTIDGFKDVNATYISSQLDLSNKTLKQNLSYYQKGTRFDEINVFNLTDNDLNIIVQSELNDIVINRTNTIQEIADSSSYVMSDFSKYCKISTIFRNGYTGAIDFNLEVSSFYNYQEDVVESLISNPSAKKISNSITLSGFIRTKKTIINQNVTIDNKTTPYEIWNQPALLKQIINDSQNVNKFFINLPTENFNLLDNLYVEIIDFNNITGSIKAKISLSSYFSDFGQFINNDGPMKSQIVNVNGFKKTRPTSLRSEISLNELGLNSNMHLENILDENVINVIEQSMYKYQNSPSTQMNQNYIWFNLPDQNNEIKKDQFNVSIDKSSINFQAGTVRLNITMNDYYNEKGILINNKPHTFNIVLTGFNKVNHETAVSTMASYNGTGIDMSDTAIAKYTVNDFETGSYTNLLLSNISQTKLNEMFDNLPYNATTSNIVGLSIVQDPDYNDSKNGILFIDLSLNNYFINVANNIEQCFNTSPRFRIKLSGLQKVDVTNIIPNIKIADDSSLKLESLQYVNAAKLNLYLNNNEIKKQILINPVINRDDGTIQTSIFVQPIDPINIDGPNGSIKVKIKFANNYYQNGQNIDLNIDPLSSQEFTTTISGFRPLPVTQNKENVIINISNNNLKASSYAQNRKEIIQLLNENKTKLFDFNGANEINIQKIINPDIVSLQEYNTSNNANKDKIYVNDINGQIKLKFIYYGGYNEHAQIVNEPRLSNVVTITNFYHDDITEWKKTADVSQNSNGMDILKIDDPNLATGDVNNTPLTMNYIECINQNLASGNNSLSYQTTDSWKKDTKNGTVSIIVSVNGWKVMQKGNNSTFNEQSEFVQSINKDVKIIISGFQKVDLDQINTNMIILISVTGGLLLLILIVLIAMFAFRRRIV